MQVRVARRYVARWDEFFANAIGRYDRSTIALPEKFAPDREFLAYHRDHIFQG